MAANGVITVLAWSGTSTLRCRAARGVSTALPEGDATVGQFGYMFGGVSQHLGVLERSGLVFRHDEGRIRRVRLEVTAVEDAAMWLEA